MGGMWMRHIRMTVGALVLQGDEVLLALRDHDPFSGKWCIPGGHVEFGEHPEDAVKREVQEETGLDLVNPRFFRYCSEYYPEMQWHAVALIFTGSGRGTLAAQPGEVRELRYVPLKQAAQMDLAFNHQDIIKGYIEGQTLSPKGKSQYT